MQGTSSGGHSREVGLQHEHGGGVAEGGDGAHAPNVVDHELVRLPHVCAHAGLRHRYRGEGGGGSGARL